MSWLIGLLTNNPLARWLGAAVAALVFILGVYTAGGRRGAQRAAEKAKERDRERARTIEDKADEARRDNDVRSGDEQLRDLGHLRD